ncbi:MAG: aspartyl protease family protein [Bacteroidales bacterium]|jgi:hypothetical protein|nr:aspartyl protease family protein [Bacteroidales bacterium]
MKRFIYKLRITLVFVISALVFVPKIQFAQDTKIQALDQNISIYAEDEPLSDIIEKICNYMNIDYQYNSEIVKDKKINLNVSNKPIKFILDKLMQDFYLLFEVQDNIMIVREYVPLEQSIDYGQNTQQFYGANRGFLFDNPRSKTTVINFKISSNLIIIPVTINDSDTLNFILDTDVRYPIITELTFIDKLNLNYMVPVTIKGIGIDGEITAYRSGNNTMHIEGLTARNQEVQMVIDEDFQISHILGKPIHGLIGLNLFKDYIVEIDYENEKIRLKKPEYFNYKSRNKDIVMPIIFDGDKPFVNTTIVTNSLTEVPVKLLVDTGTGDALWLSEKSDERIRIPQNYFETFLGRGLNGDLFGVKGRIDGVLIGSQILPKPIVAFPNSELIDQVISANDRNGTMGAEILRRFYVIFDYQNSKIILRPTGRIKEEFNANMSGMEIINPMPGFPIFTVSSIIENSPAHLAGLLKNDQILSINSNSHKTFELNDINLLLQSKENKKIRLKILRNGEEIKTSFELRKTF